ncbi:rhomboid family intramembrane serine protease [Nocardioides hungaricus]
MTQPPTPETGVPTCYRHPGRESYIRCQRCDRTICPDCMHDASVGFQCPDCVAEGKQATRSGRTAYGGLRPTNAGLTSFVLIGVNVAVWLAVLATGGQGGWLYYWLSLHARGLCTADGGFFPQVGSETLCNTVGGATWVPGVADGAYWQLMTSAFTHAQPWHIAFNMLALYVLGPQLEMAIGRARFLALYLLAALTGSAFVYWFSGETTATVGASGAIFGLMGALLVVVHKIGGDYRTVLTWIAINFAFTFLFAGISWQGHLGGFLGGAAVAGVLVYAPRGSRRTLVQVSGMVAIGALTVLAIILRSATLA